MPKSLQATLDTEHNIPFDQFMQLALYAPGDGYYSSGLQKFGPEGDFVTAPELTPLFGKALANQCQQIISALDTSDILEYGAGSGQLCIDILTRLDELNALPEHYYILEVSASLRHRQQERIQQHIPTLAARVQWLDQWPTTAFSGVIIANEVLDAMPVNRFMLTEQGILESHISQDTHSQLKEEFKPCQNQRLLAYIKESLKFMDPADDPSNKSWRRDVEMHYQSEVNLYLDDWVANNYKILHQGAMFLIDYGFPRHEYYHPDRNQGTIMCHYRHKAHPNPLLHPGEQDITAHVDFTHVAEAGQQAGFHVAGYTNQASFLLANDLLSFIDNYTTEKEQFNAKQAIKQLTHPSEMGELFKVIALTKGLDIPLKGFMLQDKRASL